MRGVNRVSQLSDMLARGEYVLGARDMPSTPGSGFDSVQTVFQGSGRLGAEGVSQLSNVIPAWGHGAWGGDARQGGGSAPGLPRQRSGPLSTALPCVGARSLQG